MGTRKSSAAHNTAADTTKAVDEFMETLDHPLKATIESIRASILSADSRISEGIKWNAPSFRTTEYFATTHLREKKGVGVILHLGAKARELPAGGIAVEDPENLLEWLGKDRAMVVFRDLADFKKKQAAFEGIVKSWIAHV